MEFAPVQTTGDDGSAVGVSGSLSAQSPRRGGAGVREEEALDQDAEAYPRAPYAWGGVNADDVQAHRKRQVGSLSARDDGAYSRVEIFRYRRRVSGVLHCGGDDLVFTGPVRGGRRVKRHTQCGVRASCSGLISSLTLDFIGHRVLLRQR